MSATLEAPPLPGLVPAPLFDDARKAGDAPAQVFSQCFFSRKLHRNAPGLFSEECP